jgi:hypothetical protein
MHARSSLLPESASAAAVREAPITQKQKAGLNGFERLPIQRSPSADNTLDDFNEEVEEEENGESENVTEEPEESLIQKKCADCEKDEEAQRSPLTHFIQNKNSGDKVTASDKVSQQIQTTKGGGSAMPQTTKSFMENRFGTDFSNVRIHTGDYAAEMSKQLSARAFTVGNDIYFNTGKYSPETSEGKNLLAHELTHTIQQGDKGKTSTPSSVVQRSFWSFIKKAAGSVWGGIKKAGQGIAAGGKWLWNKVKWMGGQLIDKIAGIFQRFAYWMTQLPQRIFRLLSGLFKGLRTFKPWTLSWWKSLAELDTWKNFLKWIGSRVVEIAEIGGVGEIYETIMDFTKFNTRVLSPSEIKAGKSIFGNSINFDFVRVDEGAVIGPLFSGRAYTSFHTINSWGTESTDVMIHEMTHVWQFEHAGAIYMPQAIHAQVWGGGYDYGGVSGLMARQNSGKGFQSFNREQQAQIVQDFFQLRQTGYAPRTGAAPGDLPLYADFVKTVSTLPIPQLVTPV